MNSLSIILYLIDVLGNLQGLLTVVGVCCVLAVVFLIAFWFTESRYYSQQWDRPFHGAFIILAVIFTVTCGLVAVAIPSKTTMQMIAVSEASEMVIMNEEVRSVMTDVKDVLKAQLNKLKE